MFQTFELNANKAATPDRVAALRAELAAHGVDGFLVPRADAHQGEYVAPHDERLAWVSGFTGSAGNAVVLSDRAALVVDGRYTLQASHQVFDGLFEVVAMHVTSMADWLADVLQDGQKLAYDPWLHGKAEIDRLRMVVEEAGAQMVALPGNPIDAVWEDQPPKPAGAVRVHPAEISGRSSADKRKSVGEEIAKSGANSAVLSLPDSIAWLLNVRGSDVAHSPVAQGFAIAHGDGRVDLIMEPDKMDGDVRAHLGNDVTVHTPGALADVLEGLTGKVLLDKGSCPLWFAEQFEAKGREIVWGRDPCILPKAVKNDAELQGMRDAHIRDGRAMVQFLHWLDTALAADQALTEIDIVQKLEDIRADQSDLYDISFDTIAGAGEHGAIIHYRVNNETNRALIPGELLLVDSGGQYPDGTTDITRTMATGPTKPEYIRDFTLVLRGMIAISLARWPVGLTGRDLDPLARQALWRAGLDYDHGTGHGVGACLNVHEGPQSLSRRGAEEFLPGMIVSNEPGYYVPGSHGIRIENLVIVSPADTPTGGARKMLGFETITWCPIDRRLIDVDLLDTAERNWLNDYHAKVVDLLAPGLDIDVVDWMRKACAPI
ncbi:MAG: aminopeptidase P family protein [Pseudomonadota bacterium]